MAARTPSLNMAIQRVKDLQKPSVLDGAMCQCALGAESTKPTLWMDNAIGLKKHLFSGWPEVGNCNESLGPLPKSCGHAIHKPLIGQNKQSKSRTSSATAYPEENCRILADAMFQ
eukprot:7222150-Karenia_brevis.AAC.1